MISVVKRDNEDVYDCFETVMLENFLGNPNFNVEFRQSTYETNGGQVMTNQNDIINPITRTPFAESTKYVVNWPEYRRKVALKEVDSHINNQDQLGNEYQQAWVNSAQQEQAHRTAHQQPNQLSDSDMQNQYQYHFDSSDYYHGNHQHSRSFPASAIVSIAFVLGIVIAFIVRFFIKKKRKDEARKATIMHHSAMIPPVMTTVQPVHQLEGINYDVMTHLQHPPEHMA